MYDILFSYDFDGVCIASCCWFTVLCLSFQFYDFTFPVDSWNSIYFKSGDAVWLPPLKKNGRNQGFDRDIDLYSAPDGGVLLSPWFLSTFKFCGGTGSLFDGFPHSTVFFFFLGAFGCTPTCDWFFCGGWDRNHILFEVAVTEIGVENLCPWYFSITSDDLGCNQTHPVLCWIRRKSHQLLGSLPHALSMEKTSLIYGHLIPGRDQHTRRPRQKK